MGNVQSQTQATNRKRNFLLKATFFLMQFTHARAALARDHFLHHPALDLSTEITNENLQSRISELHRFNLLSKAAPETKDYEILNSNVVLECDYGPKDQLGRQVFQCKPAVIGKVYNVELVLTSHSEQKLVSTYSIPTAARTVKHFMDSLQPIYRNAFDALSIVQRVTIDGQGTPRCRPSIPTEFGISTSVVEMDTKQFLTSNGLDFVLLHELAHSFTHHLSFGRNDYYNNFSKHTYLTELTHSEVYLRSVAEASEFFIRKLFNEVSNVNDVIAHIKSGAACAHIESSSAPAVATIVLWHLGFRIEMAYNIAVKTYLRECAPRSYRPPKHICNLLEYWAIGTEVWFSGGGDRYPNYNINFIARNDPSLYTLLYEVYGPAYAR